MRNCSSITYGRKRLSSIFRGSNGSKAPYYHVIHSYSYHLEIPQDPQLFLPTLFPHSLKAVIQYWQMLVDFPNWLRFRSVIRGLARVRGKRGPIGEQNWLKRQSNLCSSSTNIHTIKHPINGLRQDDSWLSPGLDLRFLQQVQVPLMMEALPLLVVTLVLSKHMISWLIYMRMKGGEEMAYGG